MANKIKLILIILVGLILLTAGVFATFLLVDRLQSNTGTPPAEEEIVEKTTVVVLSRDLSLGDAITPEDVSTISVPVDIVPRNVITSVEDAVGKMIKTDLVQGEMLLQHNLADPTNNNDDLNFILSDDHVLMAFPATDVMSRESMVQRGDIVDIFATFSQELSEMGEEGEEIVTKMFTMDTMQNVSVTAMILEVISEAQSASLVEGEASNPEPETSINAYLLALDPQDALILKYLKDNGAIFDIVLRAPTSKDSFSLTPVSAEYIAEYYGLDLYP